MPGARDRKSARRQRVDGADPPHHLRAGAHRRLRDSLRHRPAIRRRLRPRLQPHEFPLGQCRHVPDLARIAHVAGGEEILQRGSAGADHGVFRRAAGLHAPCRRRLRLRDPADGLRRDRHRLGGTGRAGAPRQGAHRQRHGAGRLRNSARRLRQSTRSPLRNQGSGGGRRAGPLPFPSRMGRLHGKIL